MRSLRVPRLLLVASVAFAVAACGAGKPEIASVGDQEVPQADLRQAAALQHVLADLQGAPCGGQPAEGESAATACDRAALSGELLWLAVAPYAEAHDITAGSGDAEPAVAQLETAGRCGRARAGARRPQPDARRSPRAGAEDPHDPSGARGGRGGTDRRGRAPDPVRGPRVGVHERRGEPHPARDEGRGGAGLPAGEGREPRAIRGRREAGVDRARRGSERRRSRQRPGEPVRPGVRDRRRCARTGRGLRAREDAVRLARDLPRGQAGHTVRGRGRPAWSSPSRTRSSADGSKSGRTSSASR